MISHKSMSKSYRTLLNLVSRHTQSGVARVCRVDHAAVHRWVKRGRFPRTAFTNEVDYFQRLHEAFGVSIEDLKDNSPV